MKFWVTFCASVLVAVMLLSVLPVRGEEEIYDNMIRLHVSAASDSEEDQRIKLCVRDGILSDVEELIGEETEFSSAYAIIASSAERLKNTADGILEREGFDGTSRVYFDRETYPERYYDGYTLPSGEYYSLRIVIGDGDGHNWWCVLFPSVCRSRAEAVKKDYVAAGFSSSQYKLITENSSGKYKVRFKILELLSGLFGQSAGASFRE